MGTDERKFLETVNTPQSPSMTDGDLEHTQFFDLHNNPSMNGKGNDGVKQDSIDAVNHYDQSVNESVDHKREPAVSNEGSGTSRRYPEKTRLVSKRFAFTARKLPDTDAPTVREVIDFEHETEWGRAIVLELEALQEIQTRDIME